MILVYVDHDRGTLDEPSVQALTFAKKLDGEVHAFVAGAEDRKSTRLNSSHT